MYLILTDDMELVNLARINSEQVADLRKFNLGPINQPVDYTPGIRFVRDESDIENQATDLLLLLGIPANLQGFNYIIYSLCFLVKNNTPDSLSMTKFLYPEISKKFKTTSSRVERSIRHAIQIACKKGTIEKHPEMFGTVNGKMTNSQFIHGLKLYLQRTACDIEH